MISVTTALRRTAMWTTIVSFSIAALIGIFAILTAGDFNDTVARVMGTTFTIGVMGLALLCYAAVADQPIRWFGLAGAAIALVPFVLTLLLIWDPDFAERAEDLWNVYSTTLTVAATLAQACLLLGLTGTRRGAIRTITLLTVAAASLVAVLIIVVVWSDIEPGFGYFQILSIAAILDALGTVTVIALRVFSGQEPPRAASPAPTDASRTPLPPDLDAWLQQVAEQHGTSRDALVRQAVTEYVDRRP